MRSRYQPGRRTSGCRKPERMWGSPPGLRPAPSPANCLPIARLVLLLLALITPAFCAYDVQVDLKNVSGEAKTDWPVILRVYSVFGRNLRPERINPQGYHVYDASGHEIAHSIEVIPPNDQPGNDEIIFRIARIAPGETVRYRITNTNAKSRYRRNIDVADSPHNLISTDAFTGAARDNEIRRGEKPSLMLTADGETVSAKYSKPLALHKGSWYYFGAWSKTRNVGRFGYEAGKAAHFNFRYAGATGELGATPAQCSTRDWLKVTFESGMTDWGVERYAAQAMSGQANVELTLEQRKHYYMEDGNTRGTWWLADVVLLEQPEVSVRFDLALAPQMQSGIFLFTRPVTMPLGKLIEQDRGKPVAQIKPLWTARPFAHEKLTPFDRAVLKGQRASFNLGLYHTGPVKNVLVRLAGGALSGPSGERIPLESLEYCPGYLGPNPSRYMPRLRDGEAVSPEGNEGVRYFFLTFLAPRAAKPGRYTGTAEVLIDGNLQQRIPITLRVQDMAQPALRDLYVGLIYNGGLPDVDQMLEQYARSGFSQIMWFHHFIPYKRGDDGKMHVDAEKLEPKMKQLLDLGITAGCGLYTDVQLDDKPKGHRGIMVRMAAEEAASSADPASGEKQAYARLIRELDDIAKRHPEWPRIIHMNWDEPPPFNEKMGWTNEILPDAPTTLDVQFARLPRILKYYNLPNFDDPADWAGPELYDYMKRAGKDFGLCGAADTSEANRYQAGMFMIASGAKYFHAWHIRGGHTAGQMAYDAARKQTVRGHEMISWAEGMDDLKAYRLLRDAIEDARKSGRNPEAVKSAEAYLAKIFAVFNGDHKQAWSLQPYLGTAWSWGYEQFYDDWQQQMLRHAAAIKGIRWIN